MCPSVLSSDCLSSIFILSVDLGIFREHHVFTVTSRKRVRFGMCFLSALSGDTKSNNKNDDDDDDYDEKDDDNNKILSEGGTLRHIYNDDKTYYINNNLTTTIFI